MNYGRLIVWTLVLSPFLMAGEKEQRAAQIVQRAQNINATKRGSLPPYRQIVEFVIKAPGIPDVPGKFIHDFLDTTHHRIRMISET